MYLRKKKSITLVFFTGIIFLCESGKETNTDENNNTHISISNSTDNMNDSTAGSDNEHNDNTHEIKTISVCPVNKDYAISLSENEIKTYLFLLKEEKKDLLDNIEETLKEYAYNVIFTYADRNPKLSNYTPFEKKKLEKQLIKDFLKTNQIIPQKFLEVQRTMTYGDHFWKKFDILKKSLRKAGADGAYAKAYIMEILIIPSNTKLRKFFGDMFADHVQKDKFDFICTKLKEMGLKNIRKRHEIISEDISRYKNSFNITNISTIDPQLIMFRMVDNYIPNMINNMYYNQYILIGRVVATKDIFLGKKKYVVRTIEIEMPENTNMDILLADLDLEHNKDSYENTINFLGDKKNKGIILKDNILTDEEIVANDLEPTLGSLCLDQCVFSVKDNKITIVALVDWYRIITDENKNLTTDPIVREKIINSWKESFDKFVVDFSNKSKQEPISKPVKAFQYIKNQLKRLAYKFF